ncbi:MAG TPA: EpsG family protein [Dysgonomonas sp.]|nr:MULTISPECIES: EpsG family protein [Dysgonomonas]MBS5908490.1 EpsG family protein [Dysgonomonas mossii]HML63300.1 EpsG family protein [Dysgonomonas sp.]
MDKYIKVILIIVSFILLLFAGTREIGFDYDQYVDMYKTISLKDRIYIIYTIEIGYAFFTSLFNFIGLGFHGFLFCLSAFLIFSRLYFCHKLSPYPLLSVLLYSTTLFLVSDMGQIRNAIAYSIVMFAYIAYIDNNKKKAWILFFIACFFHNSAFILIPAFLLLKYIKQLSFKWVLIILVALLPLVIFDIRDNFSYIVPYMPTDLGLKFSAYIYSTTWGQQLGINMSFMLRIAILLSLFAYRREGEKKISYYNTILSIYVMGVFIFMLFNSIQEFAIRFGNYFKFLDLIILPIFVYLTKNKILKVIVYIAVVLYAVWSLYKLLSDPGESSYFIPYKTILF